MSDDNKVFEKPKVVAKPSISTEFDKAVVEFQSKIPEGGGMLLLYGDENGITMDVVPWKDGVRQTFNTALLYKLAEIASAYIAQIEYDPSSLETDPELN